MTTSSHVPESDAQTTRVETFAGYTLFGKIAAGGMASVYLAQRSSGGSPSEWLAVKRLHPHLTSREDVRQMFMNEARILSRLDHPNISGISDFGIQGDAPYIVMRYLHGAPLSGLLRRLLDDQRRLPMELMAYVIAQTCEGLHYAHDSLSEDGGPLGLVHRDISPQNIFVTFSGEVKLLDFGVAKAAGFHGLTRTGHIKGKYAYMSPEQVDADTLDRRSDIFSLGIVLWETLTGRHLFKRKREIDTLRAITKAVVPAASELNSDVPQMLDSICAKALVADRRRRYQTAEHMSRDLWAFLTTTKVPMGSDEVAEILQETFPDKPKPEVIAAESMNLGRSPPSFAEPTDKLPLQDGDPSEANTGEQILDDSVPTPDGGAHVYSETVEPADPRLVTQPDALARNQNSDSVDLIPWRADDVNMASTLADPNLAAEVKRAQQMLLADQVPEDDDHTMRSSSQQPLTDRPLVRPHPSDALPESRSRPLRDPIKLSPELNPEAQDTLINDAGTAAKVITTVPKDLISDLPISVLPDGPQISDGPPSLIDAAPMAFDPGEGLRRPRRSEPPPDLTPIPSRARYANAYLVACALLLVALVLIVWQLGKPAAPQERPPSEVRFRPPVAEPPIDPAPVAVPIEARGPSEPERASPNP